jgi:hypothetical protein
MLKQGLQGGVGAVLGSGINREGMRMTSMCNFKSPINASTNLYYDQSNNFHQEPGLFD